MNICLPITITSFFCDLNYDFENSVFFVNGKTNYHVVMNQSYPCECTVTLDEQELWSQQYCLLRTAHLSRNKLSRNIFGNLLEKKVFISKF